MKAAIYVRYSSEDMDEDEYNIDNQIEKCKEYCIKSSFAIYKIYIDTDVSGFGEISYNLQSMFVDYESKAFGKIVLYSLNRLTRDTSVLVKLNEVYFSKEFSSDKSTKRQIEVLKLCYP